MDQAASGLTRAERISQIGVSEILQIVGRANAMIAEGVDVIKLGQGEPDFDTPDNVKMAACAAIARGETKYTALDGTPQLKQAVQAKFARENELDFALGQITVAPGAKQIIYNAFMATLNPGDEVVLAAPFWTTYSAIVTIAGANPVVVTCQEEDGFRLTPAALEAAITPKTRWLLLNSPSNPSGSAYSAAEMQGLAEVLRRHPQVWLLSDDIYEHLVYDPQKPFVTMLNVAPDLAGRTLTMNGVSKAYAMTGWRIGYAAGPVELIKAMAVVQSQSSSNPCSVSQAAAVEALNGPQLEVERRNAAFMRRRDLVVDMLNDIEGVSCRKPEGAFYVFPSCKELLGHQTPAGKRLETDSDFCAYLLETAHVAVIPGSCFGVAGYFRISYATSEESLRKACQRIKKACEGLK